MSPSETKSRKTIQRTYIITSDKSCFEFTELKQDLQDGWKVIATCPMPSSCSVSGSNDHVSKILPTCLVVIEKEE